MTPNPFWVVLVELATGWTMVYSTDAEVRWRKMAGRLNSLWRDWMDYLPWPIKGRLWNFIFPQAQYDWKKHSKERS